MRRTPFALAVAAIVVAALAAGSPAHGPAPSVPHPVATSPTLAKAVAVQTSNARRLRAAPGIVGTGVGRDRSGQPVIDVFTTRSGVRIPATLGGVRVETIVTGMIVARSATIRYDRPVPIGVSAGLADFATGTLAARVSNGSTVYALSNNHVFAGVNEASIGDPILQPGPIEDGGTDPADRIGTLADYQAIDFGGNNTIDAAIALTTAGDVGTATLPDGYGSPSSTTVSATVGQGVQKYGRTTGLTTGSINAVNVDVDVCYFPLTDTICFPGYEAHFVNQFSIPDGSVPFSASGDSGSLVVTTGSNNPVGLLFAGGDGLTIANPIDAVLQRFNVTIDGSPPSNGPPGAPTGLSALAGDGSVPLSWTAPTFDGGSTIAGYKIYRGTSPGGETLLTSPAGTGTTYTDLSAVNGTTYYYKVSAVNANGEGSLSNEASATPASLVPPSDPLPTVDDFNRGFENPLSDAGRWTNGIDGSGETGLYVPSTWLACANGTTCTAYRNATQYGPDVEVWARLSVLPGDNNQMRLLARIRQPGTSAYDGYMMRPSQLPGTDQILIERVDNDTFTTLLTVNQELVAGDVYLLRLKGSTLEAWHQSGSTWSRLGVVNDSTYSGAGYVGVGMRGTTGRADDFGARTMGATATAPGAPTSLSATPGDTQVALSWSAPSSDGGSPILEYKIYRSTTSGAETQISTTPPTVTSTSYTDTGRTNGQQYFYKVLAVNAVGPGPLSSEANATPTATTVPTAPQSLGATAGTNSVALNWSPPASNGGSSITGYRVYRGTSPNPAVALSPDLGVVTSFQDSGLVNGTTYYYKVSALNAIGESQLSNQASATPSALVPPSEPLPVLDDFNRGFENPLSDSGRWSNGVNGSGEAGLYDPSSWLACSKTTTCTAWRSNTQYGPDTEVWARLSVLAGDNNQLRLYARIQQPGTAGWDGYMLRPNQLPGTDQILFERVDNDTFVNLLTVNQEFAAGDVFLLRVKGSTIEGWRQSGSTWSRLGVVNDSTYSGAGYVGVGMRGTTGRADDFGARTMGATATVPGAPTSLSATPGDTQVALSWSAPSNGGSPILEYKIYRSTTSGAETQISTTPPTVTSTSYTDTGLTNGQQYFYKVLAVNAVGPGPLSSEATATPTAPATVPGQPTALTATPGNQQVALSWSAPSNGGSPILEYKIYRSTTSGAETQISTTPPTVTSTSYTDTGLTNGQQYFYKVLAVNAVGPGPLSSEATATPTAPATVPGQPTALTATPGNQQVALSWSAPSSDGGSPILEYKIYRSTTSGAETQISTTPPTVTSTSYTDTGLTNGQQYFYKVLAVNAVGPGPLSSEANAIPTDLVLPIEPLSILDTFNRPNETPLSSASWGNGILGNSERSLRVVSNQCASNQNTTATGWWKTQLAADQESYATVATLPGNGNAFRLYVRLQTPGSAAVDGYMLLFTQSSGTDQLTLYRITNGALTQLAVVNREIAAGNRLLLRAKGTALEAWMRTGATWTRLSRVTDSTYTGAGYAGVGIRGKTGRLDDFGAR